MRVSCAEAEDGNEAISILKYSTEKHTKFGAIFMDFQMPKCNGPDSTKQIRELGYKGKIIGVTGNAMDCDIKQFLIGGADLVLSKPISIAMLREIVDGNY
jgi:CheY-like chemotaxis protein